MAVILGDPALRHLAALKLRGGLRRQLRRLKTPSGLIFMLIGAAITVTWLGSLLLGREFTQSTPRDPAEIQRWTQLGMLAFTTVTGLTALSVRGVYLPKNEIERLFTAPVSRADLIRYRLLVDTGRTLFGALLLGLLSFRRMPVGVYGFLGASCAVLTLGVVRQLASLVLADGESRIGRFLKGRKLVPVRVVLGVLIWAMLTWLIMGDKGPGRLFESLELDGDLTAILELPILKVLLAPFKPWAAMMTATTLGGFLLWGGLCAVIWLALFELTARLPIDHREASLQTSNDISARLQRIGRGGGVGASEVSKGAAARRIPWFVGRGPMRAVAWIKTATILRKARGTLLVGLFVVAILTFAATKIFAVIPDQSESDAAVMGSGMIGLLGVLYLSSILRFDFRSDIDRMVQIKAWPLSPTRIFVATLLPEVVLITVILSAAILLFGVAMGGVHPMQLVVILGLPFAEFAWLAVDNSVYLFAPVRFIPGQEGSVHHVGRSIVLFLLRGILTALTLALVGAPSFLLLAYGPEYLGISDQVALSLAATVTGLVLAAEVYLLARIGGWMLRRFDGGRDQA
jgi:hypothetical protein